jgi:hypothetical protein
MPIRGFAVTSSRRTPQDSHECRDIEYLDCATTPGTTSAGWSA